MPSATDKTPSPFSFLASLNGSLPLHRKVLSETRRAELEIAAHMVAGAKVSLLYAYSGNGKSSFINAGLIPFFVAHGYAVFLTRPRPPAQTQSPVEAFKTCVLEECFLPEISSEQIKYLEELKQTLQVVQDPAQREHLAALVAQLEPYLVPTVSSEDRTEDFRQIMARHVENGMHEFVKEVQQALGPATRMLFICDQFEELFVHFSNTQQMDSFVKSVVEICRDKTIKAQFLFSMREDWVGSMVEFRQQVPDIFGSYFKLAPLRRKQAPAALLLPLATHNISISDDLVERLLSDLCHIYETQQLLEFSPVKLMRSDKNDPYLELPALQVVAEELWRTRGSVPQPFTMNHYEEIGKNGLGHGQSKESPAAAILSNYLQEFIGLPDSSELSKAEAKEARLDVLYLLTDRRAHRRALTENQIRERLLELRPNALELPVLSNEQIRSLLDVLVQARLVRVDSSATGETQYELAHDFAVREVVRSWGELDERRSAEVAFRERQEKEISKRRLEYLYGQELSSRIVLTIVSFLLLVCSAVRFIPTLSTSLSSLLGPPIVLELTAGVCVAALGLVGRLRGAAFLGLVTIASLPWSNAVDYQTLFQDFQRSPGALTEPLPAHLLTTAPPSMLALSCCLLLFGLLTPLRRDKLKRMLYSAAVEMYEMSLIQCAVGLAIWIIFSTPLVKMGIVPAGPWWWLAKLAFCATLYALVAILTVKYGSQTPGSWLAGFRWGKAGSTSLGRVALWIVTASILGVVNDFSVFGGLLVSIIVGLLSGTGSISAWILGAPPTPTDETAALERPQIAREVEEDIRQASTPKSLST